MNIFYLDENPRLAALYMIDAHVGSKNRSAKMLVEYSQMLANCYAHKQLEQAPLTQKQTVRKYSYFNHPSSKWVRQSIHNFNWLLDHALHCIVESKHRGGCHHFCIDFIKWCCNERPNLPNLPKTKISLAMPRIYYNDNPVTAYRDYYQNDKIYDNAGKFMATWTNREIPYWFDKSKLESK